MRILSKTIGISIDIPLNEKMEKQSVNKSKLINTLLRKFFKSKDLFKKFKNKV
jgi:hypothetical protein